MLKVVRRWAALSHDERKVTAAILGRLVVVSLRLRVTSYRRLVTDLGLPTRRHHHHHPSNALQPERLGILVNRVAGFLPWKPNCLTRSLTLAWLLRDRGMEPKVQLGVRRDGEILVFHAWVELDGRVVNDRPYVAQQYASFGEQGPPRSAIFI